MGERILTQNIRKSSLLEKNLIRIDEREAINLGVNPFLSERTPLIKEEARTFEREQNNNRGFTQWSWKTLFEEKNKKAYDIGQYIHHTKSHRIGQIYGSYQRLKINRKGQILDEVKENYYWLKWLQRTNSHKSGVKLL